MFERLSNSWELVKASAAVLRADKELLVFPIVSAVLSLLVLITFAVPAVLAGLFDETVLAESGFPVAGYVVGFCFYVVQYFVIFFCNTALVGAALIRLRGGDPTVGDGFRIAGGADRADPGLRGDCRDGRDDPASHLGAQQPRREDRRVARRPGLEPGHVPRRAGARRRRRRPHRGREAQRRAPAQDLGRADCRQPRDGRRVRSPLGRHDPGGGRCCWWRPHPSSPPS